ERVTNGHGTTSGPNHRGTGGRPSRWNAILWMTEACGERRTTAAHAAAHGGTTRPAARPGGSRCEIETATPVRPHGIGRETAFRPSAPRRHAGHGRHRRPVIVDRARVGAPSSEN